ncbi:DUF1289 domain-containing protein [Luteibacter aegosomatis]|uniref:DUF1289 domain-containing protein n=1 Tax=Luteibacter aegosomatis TaxID=2911537 RepID=UPI0031F2F836
MMGGMVTASSSQLPLTPCTGVCRIGARGLCEGCLRTLDEIAGWSRLDDSQKLWIMDEVLPNRQAG